MKIIMFILAVCIALSMNVFDFVTSIFDNDETIENQYTNTLSNEELANNKEDELEFSYSSIPDHVKDKMIGKSMPDGSSVSFDELSYLTLTYYGFDDKTHIGEMIVNSDVASEVVDIFKELYEHKYPIEKIRLIDEYDGIDENSMSDNNSSAFCYRKIANTTILSNHSQGLAIDINPLQNPHVVGDNTYPKDGYEYKDRSTIKKGMVQKGDACYNAFTKRGWSWGGYWENPDYQHFEKTI